MNVAAFKLLLDDPEAGKELEGPLKAMWEAGRGAWEAAHNLVQDDPGQDAAWVHAFLHRQEGDQFNASYWYSRAGKPVETGDLDTEWESIVAVFLSKM